MPFRRSLYLLVPSVKYTVGEVLFTEPTRTSDCRVRQKKKDEIRRDARQLQETKPTRWLRVRYLLATTSVAQKCRLCPLP